MKIETVARKLFSEYPRAACLPSDLARTPATIRPSEIRRYIFAGLSASLIGAGLVRFAYTPLLPSLIEFRWFPASDVVYLGASNMVGYLVGALLGRPLANRITNVQTLRAMSVLASLSLLACAFPISVGWFFVWRLLSGVSGGVTIVLVGATILPHVPTNHRGLASGVIFLGLGLGIAASGTIVPLLLRFGLHQAWLGLAALSAFLTAASWTAWPPTERNTTNKDSDLDARILQNHGFSTSSMFAQFALMALAPISAMIFLVDFVARNLHGGAYLGSLCWIIYGVGAILGPLIYGYSADRFGASFAVRSIFFIQTVVLIWLVLSSDLIIVGLISMIIGTFPSGIIPLVLAWIREAIPGNVSLQNRMWSQATIIFATAQAIGAYVYSAIFNASGVSHRTLFAISAAALGIALFVNLVASNTTKKI